jgi:hypothetical protein
MKKVLMFIVAILNAKTFAQVPGEGEVFRYEGSLQISKVAIRLAQFASEYLEANFLEEDIGARKYYVAELDGDGTTDVLMTTSFTLPASNGWSSDFILAFGNPDKEIIYYHFGEKGIRAIKHIDIRNSGIRVTALNYLPSDAYCCPSEEEEVVLLLRGNRLMEADLVKELDEIDVKSVSGESVYLIGSGDTLAMIARKFEMSLEELMDLNPGIDSRRIWIGQILIVRKRS